MSIKAATRRVVLNGISPSSEKNTQMGLKEQMKLLERNELSLDDVDKFTDEFLLKPQLGDFIQFELHKFCQKDFKNSNPDLVVKLSELCYSPTSVSFFKNIHRFVGCAYHVCTFLIKKERYKPAVNVMNSLFLRKSEILECTKENEDTRRFLCNLHGSFMGSAILLSSKLTNSTDELYQTSHELVMESLNIFKLVTTQQIDLGKKVLKTTILYLQTMKYYTEENISQFYKLLRDIFNILIPKMGEVDYLLFYTHKMHMLKRQESDIHQVLKKTVHLFSIFINCSELVRNILNKMVDFFWDDCNPNNWINDEEFKVLSQIESHIGLYFIIVSSIFNYGMQYVCGKFNDSWYENISVGFVEKLSGTIMDFHKSCLRFQKLYFCSRKGPYNVCFGDLLTGNLHKIQYIVRLCLKNKIPNALSLVPITKEAFELSVECLRTMKAAGCSEQETTMPWKISVVHLTNTVEDIYKMTPTDESWSHLKDCAKIILKEIVNNNSVELPFDLGRVKILFQRWHTASLRLKDCQEALFVCLVLYVFYPKEDKDIMSMWLQTKLEASNEVFEEITMSEMLKTCDKSLREFSKSYSRSNVSLKSALLMELKAYSTCFPDVFKNANAPYKLALKIWKQLGKCELDPWESSMAMSSVVLASAAGEVEKLPQGFPEKCQRQIEELMNSEETECRNLLHAANLIFSLFLHNVKTAERSEGKMDTTHMVLGYLKKAQQEKVKFGDDVDLNLNCDVIPASKHLTVELETNYLNELNKVVDLWGAAIRVASRDLPAPGEFDLWLRNVRQVALWYELIGEYQRTFTTWLMFYKIGKLALNWGAVLLGLTRLMESCADVDESPMKEEAELAAGKVGSESSEKYILVEFFIGMASNYLKNKKPEKCVEYLTLGRKMLESLRTTIATSTLNAKLWCLISQFLVVYREYEAVFEYPEGTDARAMAFKAFSYASGNGMADLIRSATQLECTELVLAKLHVNLWAYHLHWVYRQTDFMRFFLDDLYQIVQKLFLPTRTAEMLVRLAEADVICEKTADCQEKVIKLKSILTILSPGCWDFVKPEKPCSPYLSVPHGTDSEIATLRPTSPVRFRDSRPLRRELDVSPVQYYLNNAKSDAREHEKKCKCRVCQNLLIQMLTLNTRWLEAEMSNLNGDTSQAGKFYGEACETLERVERARDEQSKSLRLEAESALSYAPGACHFKLGFVQFHAARFLLKYALFEATCSGNVVGKTLFRINKLMKGFTFEEKLLQWAFVELKLYCFVLSKGVEKPPRKSSPVLFKTASIANTPLIGGRTSKTPTMTGKSEKCAKSPQIDTLKKEPTENPSEIGFVDAIRPRKLNFDGNEPEQNSKTVKKASGERLTRIQSRKLDFDVSPDIFEDCGTEKEKSVPAKATRSLRQARKTPAAPSTNKKSTAQKSVKIYLDTTEDAKTRGRKVQSKKKLEL